MPSVWTDYFYWDGAQPVFYGEYYFLSLYSMGGGCDYWWDEPTTQWYALELPDCPV